MVPGKERQANVKKVSRWGKRQQVTSLDVIGIDFETNIETTSVPHDKSVIGSALIIRQTKFLFDPRDHPARVKVSIFLGQFFERLKILVE